MVWFALSLMTAAAVSCVTWPLLRPRRQVDAGADDLAFYRDQIRELEADVERGLLRPADIEATRTELGRRLISASDRATPPPSGLRRRWLAAALAASGVIVVSTGLYAAVGHPAASDEPLAAREGGPDGFALALARMEAHLVSAPNDGAAFELMAPVYMRLQRFESAARAYETAIRILGPTPARLSALGQARVLAADGVVTDDARAAFDDALKADPREPEARFFEGLAALQDGDKAKARALWTALVDDAPPRAPYVSSIRDRLAKLDDAVGPAVAPPRPSAGPGPAPMAGMPAGAAAIAALPSDQQQVAIRGMVDGLAARLARDGNDPDGWLRLVRAYGVLGEPDLARKALAEARQSVGRDPTVGGRLDRLAHELGLEG